MTAELTVEERETHLNMGGDDHGTWTLYSDDPYWIRRLDKLGVPCVIRGAGREYTLTADQVLIRRGKRRMSDATRHAAGQRLKNYGGTGVLTHKQTIVEGPVIRR